MPMNKSAPGYATLHFISVLRTHSYFVVSTIPCPRDGLVRY